MNELNYTTVIDSDGIKILSYHQSVIDTQSVLPVIASLSTDAPPSGATSVLQFNEKNKWGQVLCRVGGVLLKAVFTHRHLSRQKPFEYIDHEINGWEGASGLGLQIPAFKGVFTVRRAEGYIWNGVIIEYLDGWRNLDPKNSEDDDKLMRKAIEDLAVKGVINRDMHAGNVMTDGNGNYKMVDLDRLEFGCDATVARTTMTAFYEESLNWLS